MKDIAATNSPAVRAERFHKWVRRNKASPNEC